MKKNIISVITLMLLALSFSGCRYTDEDTDETALLKGAKMYLAWQTEMDEMNDYLFDLTFRINTVLETPEAERAQKISEILPIYQLSDAGNGIILLYHNGQQICEINTGNKKLSDPSVQWQLHYDKSTYFDYFYGLSSLTNTLDVTVTSPEAGHWQFSINGTQEKNCYLEWHIDTQNEYIPEMLTGNNYYAYGKGIIEGTNQYDGKTAYFDFATTVQLVSSSPQPWQYGELSMRIFTKNQTEKKVGVSFRHDNYEIAYCNHTFSYGWDYPLGYLGD